MQTFYNHKAVWLEINLKVRKFKKKTLSWTILGAKGKIQTELIGFLENNHNQNTMNLNLYDTAAEIIKRIFTGLPWWRSGWESACQCRGHGFEPWSGKIPHAAEQLGPWATATEPARLEPVLRNRTGRDSERPAHCNEEWPPLAPTRESPHTETKTQHSQK